MDRELVEVIFEELSAATYSEASNVKYSIIMRVIREYEEHKEELKEAISRYNNEGIGCILVDRKIDCINPSLLCGDSRCTDICYKDLVNHLNYDWDRYSNRPYRE